jgi:hypothetical protein
MITELFARTERVMASVTSLLLFTLNELRMFHTLPRVPEATSGNVYSASLRLFGGTEPLYLSMFDLTARWGLAALTVALSVWAVAETLKRAPAKAGK